MMKGSANKNVSSLQNCTMHAYRGRLKSSCNRRKWVLTFTLLPSQYELKFQWCQHKLDWISLGLLAMGHHVTAMFMSSDRAWIRPPTHNISTLNGKSYSNILDVALAWNEMEFLYHWTQSPVECSGRLFLFVVNEPCDNLHVIQAREACCIRKWMSYSVIFMSSSRLC
jgi:hypothetical protein